MLVVLHTCQSWKSLDEKKRDTNSDKAKYFLIKKYNEANSLLKRKFVKAITPGQVDAFIASMWESMKLLKK